MLEFYQQQQMQGTDEEFYDDSSDSFADSRVVKTVRGLKRQK